MAASLPGLPTAYGADSKWRERPRKRSLTHYERGFISWLTPGVDQQMVDALLLMLETSTEELTQEDKRFLQQKLHVWCGGTA